MSSVCSPVRVCVRNDVYELLGEISSSTNEEDEGTDELEQYLITNDTGSSPQIVARVKHTSRGGMASRRGKSPGGKQLATKPIKPSRRRVESSSSEEEEPEEPTQQTAPAKPAKKLTGRELCREWNRTGRIGLTSETAQGWLKKTTKKRNQQGKALRRWRPGTKALQEIRFYQRCRTFLIPVIPFQKLVREVCDDDQLRKTVLRW